LGAVVNFRDISERKKAEEQRRLLAERLENSNQELQQFAYVVSHDLQEPLRMVSSYLQLIERRYQDRLDQDGTEFIEFAVDGATRMSAMIEGLLQYSRVETQGSTFSEADLEVLLGATLENLQLAIDENEAEVEHGPLPRLSVDASQIMRLLQNLIGNALKFRSERPPRVRVEAEQKDGEWIFSVADNGIGIPADQGGRIFGMFQRLHTRDVYPGMGVGLAVCKRIVERHGGRIWVESEEGAGSTFYFTLPQRD
jgi:light-regulated signal transduction histidine kinase (bacteriophytochrome)